MKIFKNYIYYFSITIFSITIFALFNFPILKIYDTYLKPDQYNTEEISVLINYLSDLENNFIDSLNLSLNDITSINNNPPEMQKFISKINDDVYFTKKYHQMYSALLEGPKFIENNLDIIFNPLDTLKEINTVLNSKIMFSSWTHAAQSLSSKEDVSEFIKVINYESEFILDQYLSLMFLSLSNKEFEYERIETLIEWYSLVQFISDNSESFDKNLNQKDILISLEDLIYQIFEDGDPAFGFYCLTRLSEIRLMNVNKKQIINDVIDTVLWSHHLLLTNFNKLKWNMIEYSFLVQSIQKSNIILLSSISQFQSSTNLMNQFQSILNNIENTIKVHDNKYWAYYSMRQYYLHAIDAIAKLQIKNDEERHKKAEIYKKSFGDRIIIDWIFETWIKNKQTIIDISENQLYVLDLIEKNKSRIFKEQTDVKWIKEPPKLLNDQIGINYIVGHYYVIAQIYESNKIINTFYCNLKEIESLWDNIKSQIELNPNNNLVNSLLNIIIPKNYQELLDNKHIIISPDGILGEIPFQYLLNNQNIKSITFIPGFSFFNNNNGYSNINSMCALSSASPEYEQANNINLRSKLKTNKIINIPFADIEVDNISKKFNKIKKNEATVIKDVKESWVKKNIIDYDIIHFAAHSMEYIDEVNEPGILLSKSEKEDGILSNSEIRSLKINAEIVFLSSCESGTGGYLPGEGINSIANAFLNAGTNAVIASLWPIEDTATQDLVNIFYSEYFKNNNASVALYNAQNIFQNKFSGYSPYKLFPFIIIKN